MYPAFNYYNRTFILCSIWHGLWVLPGDITRKTIRQDITFGALSQLSEMKQEQTNVVTDGIRQGEIKILAGIQASYFGNIMIRRTLIEEKAIDDSYGLFWDTQETKKRFRLLFSKINGALTDLLMRDG